MHKQLGRLVLLLSIRLYSIQSVTLYHWSSLELDTLQVKIISQNLFHPLPKVAPFGSLITSGVKDNIVKINSVCASKMFMFCVHRNENICRACGINKEKGLPSTRGDWLWVSVHHCLFRLPQSWSASHT